MLWHFDHGIEIVRNSQDFPYPFRNGVKYYRPDFIVDGHYYEIKGVMDYRSQRKLASFPFPITIIGKKEIQSYIRYAETRYGKDFYNLLTASDS